MIPSSTTSNWDFTSVINLLRAPTCQSKDLSTRDSSPGCPDTSLASHNITQHDVRKLNTREEPLKDADLSSPKLGDFDSLWELLGSTSPSPASSDTPPSKARESPQQSESHTRPLTILKRPAVTDAPAEKAAAPWNTLKQAANNTPNDRSNAQLSTPVERRRRRNRTKHDAVISNSSGGESDGSLSVFDQPHPHPKSAVSMIPPQVGVSKAEAATLETPPSSFDEQGNFLTPETVKKPPDVGPPRLRPLAYKTTTDQRVGLLTKMLKDFPDYAQTLVEAGRSKKSKKLDTSSRPIHVFVDMSNIMVGFHDTMKISRNIPVQTRIRRLPLSYQSFSMILERGRPTAKRVLAGSDRIAAISESEQLGYEASILNRVQKVKQPTARQLKFRKNPRVTAQDGGHGSETNDAAEERWVEQGVDEILHLKILESLLDTDEPATIVLATGDAAEAEFSGGFMRMVERALRRGWKVEVVSFSQVTSKAYKNKEFRSRWGDQFKMIPLDDFVEELLKI